MPRSRGSAHADQPDADLPGRVGGQQQKLAQPAAAPRWLTAMPVAVCPGRAHGAPPKVAATLNAFLPDACGATVPAWLQPSLEQAKSVRGTAVPSKAMVREALLRPPAMLAPAEYVPSSVPDPAGTSPKSRMSEDEMRPPPELACPCTKPAIEELADFDAVQCPELVVVEHQRLEGAAINPTLPSTGRASTPASP